MFSLKLSVKGEGDMLSDTCAPAPSWLFSCLLRLIMSLSRSSSQRRTDRPSETLHYRIAILMPSLTSPLWGGL